MSVMTQEEIEIVIVLFNALSPDDQEEVLNMLRKILRKDD